MSVRCGLVGTRPSSGGRVDDGLLPGELAFPGQFTPRAVIVGMADMQSITPGEQGQFTRPGMHHRACDRTTGRWAPVLRDYLHLEADWAEASVSDVPGRSPGLRLPRTSISTPRTAKQAAETAVETSGTGLTGTTEGSSTV